jgi:hypothetical protein
LLCGSGHGTPETDNSKRLLFGVDFRLNRHIPTSNFKKENKMKKLMIVSFGLTLLMSVVALAQYGAQQPDASKSGTSMKAVSIVGTISDDGKMFVSDKEGKSWTISNPDAVKGHEGHHVILQAQVNADKGEVHVMSLKMAKGSM